MTRQIFYLRKKINIACAVATERGLIVPVLKDLNNDSLQQIAVKLDQVVEKARNNKLKPEDIKGGTFSITNPGMYGSIHAQPIINQPQVAILSIGAIKEELKLGESKQIKTQKLSQLSLSFDHRVIDGEKGAQFLADIKAYLENYI